MKIKNLLFFLFFLCQPLWAGASQDLIALDITDKSAFDGEIKKLINQDSQQDYLITLSPRLRFNTRMEGTSKGNATLSIANLVLRVADQHEDLYTFNNTTLSVNTYPATNLLSFSGIIEVWDEDEEKINQRLPLLLLLQYNCDKRQFDILIDRTENNVILNQRQDLGPSCENEST